MSVSKWAYSPAKCDGEPCVGDCDMCSIADDVEDEEMMEEAMEICEEHHGNCFGCSIANRCPL